MGSELCFVIRHNGTFERLHQVDVPETTIGRSESNVLWLPDVAVSRWHAVLVHEGTSFVIRDLDSRNGIRLNDQLVREAVLCEGAVVQIGPYRLKPHFNFEAALAEADEEDGSTQSEVFDRASVGEFADQVRRLTPGQRRVYDEFLRGLSEKEIAALLKLSIHTVHTHAKAIYRIFDVSTRSELLSHRPAIPPHRGHRDHRDTRFGDDE